MGIGCGYSAIRDWSTVMNTPSYLSKLAFQSAKSNIISGSRESFEEISRRSVEKIRERYGELGIVPDKDDVLDIAVSYEGSWHRRGHSSHTGLGVVSDLLTGLPLDFQAAKCSKNYDGSANSMEQHCALLLLQRSVAKHCLRYTCMLSDGDSKSYNYIVKEKVYGNEKSISKEECINHVSKRMGTALKNLKDQCTARGEQIGGKGNLTNDLYILRSLYDTLCQTNQIA